MQALATASGAGRIRADLRSVTKQVTAAGNIRFTAERTPDGHADHFWALALAIHAAGAPTEYGYQSVRDLQGKGDDDDGDFEYGRRHW
ncbi:MAG: hypothetical protein BGN83_07550 [Rhizobium sp. 63-7]|nr:MAG: hypothetical protein BGN83_07550 [Rhizobium sp. 63-7]